MKCLCVCVCVCCRWWPGQVVPMSDIPDNIKKKQPGEGMFVVRYIHITLHCLLPHYNTHTHTHTFTQHSIVLYINTYSFLGSVGLETIVGFIMVALSLSPWNQEQTQPKR